MQKQYVRSLFDSIAGRYDMLNHLLSGGIDTYWRWRAIRRLSHGAPARILDVATGTADFAIAAARLGPREIVGVDLAWEMLLRGRDKIARRGLAGVITLLASEAEHLPFAEGAFDAAVVAFGVRNFEDLHQGLAEMRRVLRAGGRLVVLEFSRPRVFPLRQIYLFYFLRVIPLIGRLVSGNREAYTYLPESVMAFPEGADFLSLLAKAGFRSPGAERLTFGIASVYTAEK
ncbi:MAG TPA: bifunctional demethylmenaquinone methyltransferase/2-methoxy-6-polyprenyl-1,4-benzoquinol methylase UbiE [Bacteroidota bacterium]|nr:bifunctional demethylmenaquinone methyltransferase/2-methoxy-6-polyprenyl-1,4-benzoquinol methylase UbiE [Bacteroidota bacterium]